MNSSFFMMCLARGIVKMDVTEKLCVVLTLKDGTVVRLYNCNMDEIADFYDMLENYPQDRFIDRCILFIVFCCIILLVGAKCT